MDGLGVALQRVAFGEAEEAQDLLGGGTFAEALFGVDGEYNPDPGGVLCGKGLLIRAPEIGIRRPELLTHYSRHPRVHSRISLRMRLIPMRDRYRA